VKSRCAQIEIDLRNLCSIVNATYLNDLYVGFASSTFTCAISSSCSVAVSSTGRWPLFEAIVVVCYWEEVDIELTGILVAVDITVDKE
jgi:hypothetical protein